MGTVLDLVADSPRRSVAAGTVVLEQGQSDTPLLVLMDVRVARITEPGAVLGEMSALLGTVCTASVRTLAPSTFALLEDPEKFLRSSPDVTLHVARLLARRLDSLNKYLVDVKAQYEGHDHLGMVDEVLETLMHRHPRPAGR
jgi:CRP/FNR family transcriptional regulator, cyclic AMP receptor protein